MPTSPGSRSTASPWALRRHTLTFPGGDAEPTESDVGFALTPVTDVAFDEQHLSSAHVRADDVALDDGTTADVDVTWTATSERTVYGNEGPALLEFGLVHHLHEDCLTVNNQGHQKIRDARMDGTINGASYTNQYSVLSANHFLRVIAQPSSCG